MRICIFFLFCFVLFWNKALLYFLRKNVYFLHDLRDVLKNNIINLTHCFYFVFKTMQKELTRFWCNSHRLWRSEWFGYIETFELTSSGRYKIYIKEIWSCATFQPRQLSRALIKKKKCFTAAERASAGTSQISSAGGFISSHLSSTAQL